MIQSNYNNKPLPFDSHGWTRPQLERDMGEFTLQMKKAWARMTSKEGITPLACVVQVDCPAAPKLDVVKLLVEDWNADPLQADNRGWTPLLHAAAGAHSAILFFFLEARFSPNVANRDGTMPLHKAAERSHLDDVKLLISYKAELNAADHFGTPLAYAVKMGSFQVSDTLLQAGADPNIMGDPLALSPLRLAEERDKKLILLLKKHHAELDMPLSAPAQTSLSRMVFLHGQKEAEVLARIHGSHDFNESYLFIVLNELINTGVPSSLETLKPLACKPVPPNNSIYTRLKELQMAFIVSAYAKKELDRYSRSVAHYCAFFAYDKLLAKMDEIHPLDIQDAKGRTPLHYAVIAGNLLTVYELLSYSNPRIKDHQGATPLQLACELGKNITAITLINKDPESAQIPDKMGWFPIHKAALRGDVALLSYLVKSDAKVNPWLPLPDGRTPLKIGMAYPQVRDLYNELQTITKTYSPPTPLFN